MLQFLDIYRYIHIKRHYISIVLLLEPQIILYIYISHTYK